MLCLMFGENLAKLAASLTRALESWTVYTSGSKDLLLTSKYIIINLVHYYTSSGRIISSNGSSPVRCDGMHAVALMSSTTVLSDRVREKRRLLSKSLPVGLLCSNTTYGTACVFTEPALVVACL